MPQTEQSSSNRVFVSFAYADKAFAERFARDLRSKGVDIWIAFWEIQPGDSLVRRIFDEGIGKASAVIVILSRTSVTRPWVQEELSVSKVREIEEKIRLIPVVIDDCEIPMSLRGAFHVRMGDGPEYEEGVRQIVATLFGQHSRPPLGPPPSYAQHPGIRIPGATLLESTVLDAACSIMQASGQEHISLTQLQEAPSLAEYGQQDLTDALDYLERSGYIDHALRIVGVGEIHHFQITVWGFHSYASAGGVQNYAALIKQVAAALTVRDRNGTMSDELAKELGSPEILVRHVLKWLEREDCIIMFEGNAQGRVTFVATKPALRRLLRDS